MPSNAQNVAIWKAGKAIKSGFAINAAVPDETCVAMAHEAICAWVLARALQANTSDQAHTLVRNAVGRVPALEPFLRKSLGDAVKHMDLPFDLPLGDWPPEKVVEMMSCAVAYALQADHQNRHRHDDDDVPF